MVDQRDVEKATYAYVKKKQPIEVPGQQHEPQEDTSALSATSIEEDISKTYKEAIQSKEAKEWIEAMKKEANSLEKKNTWKLTDLLPGKNLVGGKWVYTKKKRSDGTVERYKARWVAKGFTQKEGIDYNETFAPVVKYKSLRIIMALAAINDYEIKHMDVETAFLNATIKEELYIMEQPHGFEVGDGRQVCKLIKTLYGIKQAPNEWNGDLNAFIFSMQYTRCKTDTCLYVKTSKTGRTMILATFVDDIIYTGLCKTI
jgi:hypothetical protein